MTIRITDWLMTSGISPEFAERVQTRHGSLWSLTWLPGRALSFEQAYAGMEVDEYISDPSLLGDGSALARAQYQVRVMGLVWEQVVHLLANRVYARLMDQQIMVGSVPEPTMYQDDPGAIRSGYAA